LPARPGDAIVERKGVKLFLPAESRILLDGVKIDFADTAAKTGSCFTIEGVVVQLEQRWQARAIN